MILFSSDFNDLDIRHAKKQQHTHTQTDWMYQTGIKEDR